MSIVESLISVLAPAVCIGCEAEGSGLCEACIASEIVEYGERCWRCSALSPGCRTCIHCRWFGGPRCVWVTTNYEELAARAIKAYKFQHKRYLAQDIAKLMAETFLAYNQNLAKANYLVAPLPTATKRVRDRSFDHTALVAKTISRRLKLDFQPILGRLGQDSQVGSYRPARLKQLDNKFFVKRPGIVVGRNILLIDDVLTTGGSLRAAVKTLRAAGAKHVDALIFAKKI